MMLTIPFHNTKRWACIVKVVMEDEVIKMALQDYLLSIPQSSKGN